MLAVPQPETCEKTRSTLQGFMGVWGVYVGGFLTCVCVCVFCLCNPEADEQAILLLWPLKPTMGVFCWYIKRGRKGGSRTMQCSAVAQRTRMSVCEQLTTVHKIIKKTKQ